MSAVAGLAQTLGNAEVDGISVWRSVTQVKYRAQGTGRKAQDMYVSDMRCGGMTVRYGVGHATRRYK